MLFNLIPKILQRTISITILTLVYCCTLFISTIGRVFIRTQSLHQKRIIINGTFHNPNWFFAHIEPIVRSGYGEVVLICDEPIAELPGLRYSCPPQWAAHIFSRAGAKFLWTLSFGFRHRADIFMGYHIFPSAITALICGRILGAKAAYQVTSGPLELDGGGWHAENKLLIALNSPSPWIEHLAFAITRNFDLVIVRGSSAANFIRERAKYCQQLELITGSVDTNPELMKQQRDIDIIFVGRLTEYKRPDRLIQALAIVATKVPTFNAVLVGNGPDYNSLQEQVTILGLKNHIKFLGKRSDVPELMGRSRIFALTSRWEGVSIAMLEAMALEVVPIVTDVGDLSDFVKDNITGYLLDEDDIIGLSERIIRLLHDEGLRTQLAQNARNYVLSRCDRKVLTQRWNQVLNTLNSTIESTK